MEVEEESIEEQEGEEEEEEEEPVKAKAKGKGKAAAFKGKRKAAAKRPAQKKKRKQSKDEVAFLCNYQYAIAIVHIFGVVARSAIYQKLSCENTVRCQVLPFLQPCQQSCAPQGQ